MQLDLKLAGPPSAPEAGPGPHRARVALEAAPAEPGTEGPADAGPAGPPTFAVALASALPPDPVPAPVVGAGAQGAARVLPTEVAGAGSPLPPDAAVLADEAPSAQPADPARSPGGALRLAAGVADARGASTLAAGAPVPGEPAPLAAPSLPMPGPAVAELSALGSRMRPPVHDPAVPVSVTAGAESAAPVPAAESAARVPVLSIPAGPASPRFGDHVGERIVWMADQQVPQARLRVNPPELGPIEIRVSVSQNEATVQFGAQHAATREALEQALPRLREMLGASGLDLVSVDVSSEGFGDARRDQPGLDDPAPGAPSADEEVDLAADAPVVAARPGLIDHYA